MPHAGAMVLLDRVIDWTPDRILAAATSHLDPANPLRHAGRLAAVCGVEYALQSAALHGALRALQPQPAGYAASLRDILLHVDRLDDRALGDLHITATLALQEKFGMVYDFTVQTAAAAPLLQGRFSIALPRNGTSMVSR